MKIIIDSVIKVYNPDTNFLYQIKKDLTFPNQKYHTFKAIGLPVWNIPQTIKLYMIKENVYYLPRGYLSEILKSNTKYTFEDKRNICCSVDYPHKADLRDYQQSAIIPCVNAEQGIIIMACGLGKTETAMGLIAEIGQPALWITHTKDLLNQSYERAIKTLSLTVDKLGIIQAENYSIGSHITFATVQTLAKRNIKDIADKFGVVIVDECHRVYKDNKTFRMFDFVISQIPAKYRFGLTASEHRGDGLIDTMFKIIGNKVFEAGKEIDNKGYTITPEVVFIPTNFNYFLSEDERMINIQKLYKAIKDDVKRQEILKNVLIDNITISDKCLVLGDNLEHLEELKQHAIFSGRTAAMLSSKTKKKDREKIINDVRAGNYNYLFATYQLAKEGLDIPVLNKLVLATPKRDKITVQQALGRISRFFKGKNPIVYDFYDKEVKTLCFWARDRMRVYQTLGCKVSGEMPKIRKI